MADNRSQWYIGAPNGVVVCVDSTRGHQLAGKLYHSYSLEPEVFRNIEQMTYHMERLYDMLRFPHQGTNNRSFVVGRVPEPPQQGGDKVMSDESLLSKHGDIGTFIVRVQHRQNSSWQGRITWMEQNKTIQFRSVWEMIKLIESAVDTISEQDDGEAEPSWEGEG